MAFVCLFGALSSFAQSKLEVTGKVTDQNGNPIVGVAIFDAANNANGATTDSKGNYKLRVNANSDLVYVYIGHERIELNVDGRSIIDVKMSAISTNIDNVVVEADAGYKVLTARQNTGATITKKASEIMINSMPSINQMLEGQFAGVNVMTSSGEPSATPKIRIRGNSSIIGNKSPIWVLDGIILDDAISVDHSDLSGDDATYLVGNAIAGVNPQDIESITVLKDAAATALYGVQAANGVIVVTTKKGRSGAPSVSYTGNFSVTQRTSYDDLNVMNASDRMKLSAEMISGYMRYSSIPPSLGYEGLYIDYLNNKYSYDEFVKESKKMADRNTDWYDILFRNSFSHSHTLSLNGGTDRTTYYASVGYSDTQGTAIGSDSRRFNGRLNVSSWLRPQKLRLSLTLSGYTTDADGYSSMAGVNPNTYAQQTSRTIPCYNDDGTLSFYSTTKTGDSNFIKSKGIYDVATYNILNELDKTGQESKTANINTQLNLNWNIWNGISYELVGSLINTTVKTQDWAEEGSYYVRQIRKFSVGVVDSSMPEWDASILPYGGILRSGENTTRTYTLRNTLRYNKTFAQDHTVGLMAVSEIRSIQYNGFSGIYYGWQPDRGQTISAPSTTAYYELLKAGNLAPTITDNVQNYVSWLFDGTYSYKDLVTVGANVRMDGSNQFGTNPKYRFLPVWSVSGKYTLSNMGFMRDVKWLDYLAVRASYGVQGNVDSATSPKLVIQTGATNSITGMNESTFKYLPNADLHWEKTKSVDVGLDFTLFNDRVTATIDYYSKRGSDMIMPTLVSQATGQATLKINAGKVDNSGVEVGLRVYPIKTKEWQMYLTLNYAYNKNKLIKATTGGDISTADMLAGGAYIEGQPLGTLYSYEFAGLDHETGYPIFYNKEHKTTTVVNDKEYKNYVVYTNNVSIVKSGVTTPPHAGSFAVNVRYKNIRVGANFNYQFGAVGRLPSISTERSAIYSPVKNLTNELNNRWRNPGDELHTNIPVLFDYNTYSSLSKLPLNDVLGVSGSLDGYSIYDQSTARIAKTDVLRMSSLTLSYFFPESICRKLRMQNLSATAQATNLFFIADKAWGGLDPISGSAAIPTSRAFTLSLNFNF